jgi:uncharacterized protein YndB with AHSA1/START domain
VTPSEGAIASSRPALTIERRYRTTLEEMWDLWTTQAGLEAWWGPAGFAVKVVELDLRPGGTLRYVMSATDLERVAFMRNAGMPIAVETKATFTQIEPPRRLAFACLADFVPDTAPYEVTTSVDFIAEGEYVRVLVTQQAMHDDEWTARALAGWASELDKLAELLGVATST